MHFVAIEREALPSELPLVIGSSRLGGRADDLVALFRSEGERLDELLLEHGALLFRGFGFGKADQLTKMLHVTGAAPLPYYGGISPRSALGESVYTATDLPPGVRIPLHNEQSYLSSYPRQLWFACAVPAARGGETTLADGRAIYDQLDPGVRRKFVERGVRYQCGFHGDGVFYDALERLQKVTKSWMEAFETDDRAVAEMRCRQMGGTPRWLASGRLVMETVRPAVIEHPVTGDTVWFNAAHLFHLNPRGIGWTRYVLSRLFALRPETRTHEASFGDGSAIDAATIEHLFDVLDAATRVVHWERGDLLWVDNLRCMHGRNPFHGERKLLAALTQ